MLYLCVFEWDNYGISAVCKVSAWIQYGHHKWNFVVNKRCNNKTYPNHKNINMKYFADSFIITE